MDATPISFENATPLHAIPFTTDSDAAAATERKWKALHDAAAAVASLAGVADAATQTTPCDIRAALRDAPHWQRQVTSQGVDDLAAIMEPALSALIVVRAAHGDASAAANALWQEFVTARDELLALSQPRN
jgi:hypothetical protein